MPKCKDTANVQAKRHLVIALLRMDVQRSAAPNYLQDASGVAHAPSLPGQPGYEYAVNGAHTSNQPNTRTEDDDTTDDKHMQTHGAVQKATHLLANAQSGEATSRMMCVV